MDVPLIILIYILYTVYVISDFGFSFKEELPNTDNNGFLPPAPSVMRHETSTFLVLKCVLMGFWIN